MAPKEHDAEIDALYQLAPTDFVAARTALAKKLGKGVAASLVRELPKPTVSAYVVNRLYRERGKAFAALLAAGEALRRAHAQAMASHGGGALREATESQRDAVEALVADAETMLRKEGRKAEGDAISRARESLRAISTRGGFGDETAGRLSRDVPFPDFVELLGAAAATPKRHAATPAHAPPAARPSAEREPRKHATKARAARDEQARAKREAAAAERSRRRAETERAAGEKKSARERARAEAADARERARTAAAEAAAEEKAARERAEKHVAEAEDAASRAEEEVASARATLAEARRAVADAERDLEKREHEAADAERAVKARRTELPRARRARTSA